MARGAQKTAEQAADTGYNQSQQLNQQLLAQQQSLGNYLLPQYQNLINNPGYTSAEKSAITTDSTGAAAASYGSAADQAARTAARTGNTASLASQNDQLAQKKAQTMADINAKNQIQFAEASRGDIQKGLQGLSGLYGMDTNLLSRSLGIPPEYLQQYNNAANQKSSGLLGGLIGAAGDVGATMLGNWNPGGYFQGLGGS